MKINVFRAFLGAFAATAIFLFIFTGTKAKGPVHEYPETFTVIAVDRQHDFITLQDFNGFTFMWQDADDWEVNDIASAIMNNNGTEEIFDDEIIKLKYSGYYR